MNNVIYYKDIVYYSLFGRNLVKTKRQKNWLIGIIIILIFLIITCYTTIICMYNVPNTLDLQVQLFILIICLLLGSLSVNVLGFIIFYLFCKPADLFNDDM